MNLLSKKILDKKDHNNGMIDSKSNPSATSATTPPKQQTTTKTSKSQFQNTNSILSYKNVRNSKNSSNIMSSSTATTTVAAATAAATTAGANILQTNGGIGQVIGHRPRSGSAREQAVNAVEYYNSNVLRARVGAGLAGPRSSVNERHLIGSRSVTNGYHGHMSQQQRIYLNPDHLYRSNSSLELLHEQHAAQNKQNSPDNQKSSSNNNGSLRREYGSHGSIDVISSPNGTTSESFFAMLQDYRPAVLQVMGSDQRSPGPAEFLKGKVLNNSVNGVTNGEIENKNNINQSNLDENHQFERPVSPKLKNKLHRLWGQNNNSTSNSNNTNSSSNNKRNTSTILIEDCSINGGNVNVPVNSSSATTSINMNQSTNSILSSHSASTSSADIEERQRRRAFAHFDCQSLTANLGYAAKLRGLLLARRRNTTTGASAASMNTGRSATPDGDSSDEDFGDGQHNDLLENCPFFRNEIGGEEEREVSLTRMLNSHSKKSSHNAAVHRPALAYGVSILECAPNETLWRPTTCPLQKGHRVIESVDHGARYYRLFFAQQEHQNWFGMDEQLGPVAVSIKKEKLPDLYENVNTTTTSVPRYQFRMIVRTSELLTLRGSVIEDSVPNPRGPGKPISTKDLLEYVAPEIQMNCLKLGVNTPQCEQQLIKLDEQGLTSKYKVGILYCRASQFSEEDMYNNEDAGPAFMEFLETIGKRVRLKGFEHYKAGLDNKTDSTGTHSLYATYQDCEIMFHVSTMLPFTPNNRQQLLRKRHIGNDIVTVVFQEPGALPFTPKNIRSQFQHVFIIVRVINPCTENTMYKVAVSRSKEVPVFGPPIPATMFHRNKAFADFLLAKVINAENAAHRSEKFATMATRTRQEYLKDLATNYCTSTVVEPGTKFSLFPQKKKEKPKIRFSGDSIQRAAFCWQVVLQDSGLSAAVDCFLGISVETFVLIEECSRQIIFVTPTKAILGWSTCGNSLRIYHHQGECVTINMRDCGERDEQLEVIERLRAVTHGCGALELNLKRNPMGQLGFHVQPDGVVTQVETSGQAWIAGLRQGYRLVEICKIAVATLSHDQMVDLLKTSAQVTVTVIESFSDFSPRRGCILPNCKFNVHNFDNDYETIHNISQHSHGDSPSKNSTPKKSASNNAQTQQISNHHRRRYERNFSPPRSSNSSGYGTGSSSRSFSIPNDNVRHIPDMGTLTSSSSGHSSNDDRWYDVLENCVEKPSNGQIHKSQQKSGDHQKLNASNSLPLNNTSRPLSVHDPTKLSSLATANDHIRPSPRMANVEYLVTKSSNHQQQHQPAEILIKHLTLTVDPPGSSDINTTNNELIYNTKSIPTTDDEMHLDCSPRLRRSATTTNITKLRGGSGTVSSSSTSSSRNNSPRPQSEAILSNNMPPPLAAAKLRHGANNRNHQQHLMQRNSVNYTASTTFQEDLMKLINPDYITIDDSIINTSNSNHNVSIRNSIHPHNHKEKISNSHSLGNISAITGKTTFSICSNDDMVLKNKSRSREGINLGTQHVPELKNNDINEQKTEVIFTTARPATVISQNNNSPSTSSSRSSSTTPGSDLSTTLKTTENENVLHISEGTPNFRKMPQNQSTRKKIEQPSGNLQNNNKQIQLPLLPDPNDLDWSSLVDTATRAMMLQFQQDEQRKGNDPMNETETNNVMRNLESVINHIEQNSRSNIVNGGGSGEANEVNGVETNNTNPATNTSNEIKTHLTQLEDRILRETRRRKSLEYAVRKLTEENRRLQDESQAAVQQLRRFTEWFFQTIDRQS
ncbi:signal-induced proliferation-associated 1-like protein 1 [Condylostylus longicornis]|uniref:signal-induced proliferation-associated 1-like protein 1 n=1 Tax=Condylostylus longicornis TaxID=2530218 RepID=UPI00244DA3F1|nr:signal-induced proliferation-associated 1-like protein 1 [Condylostylus longicornis]